MDGTSQLFLEGRGTHAREAPQQPPSLSSPRKGATTQHIQHREANAAGPYLKQGDGVVHQEDWIGRFISDLRAKHKRQLQILAVCKKSTPPVQQSVRAGEAGRVLEQGEGVRNGGQQLVVHGAARRTVD